MNFLPSTLTISNYILITKLAKLLSILLHPLLMPTILFALLFYVSPTVIEGLSVLNNQTLIGAISIKSTLLLLLFIHTFLMPAISIYFLYRLKVVKSLEMNELEDRRIPYLLTVVIYVAITAFFSLNDNWGHLPEISLILASITFSLSMVALISLFWKISAHAVGISGTVGAMIGIAIRFEESHLFYPILLLIVLMGFLISARLHLNAHTPLQVLAGTLLGLTISLLAVQFV